jgi:hypothetical protein
VAPRGQGDCASAVFRGHDLTGDAAIRAALGLKAG